MRGLWASVVTIAVALALLTTQAGAEPGVRSEPAAKASAYGVKIMLPNQAPIVGGLVETASAATAAPTGFAYPEDGSVVRIGSMAGRSLGGATGARARSDLRSVSLFGGEISVDALVAGASARAAVLPAGGSFVPTTISGLVALGQPVTPAPNLRIQLGDWGHLTLLQEREAPSGEPSFRGWVTVLDMRLDADHAGLPIGTRIIVGYAEASARHRRQAARPLRAAVRESRPAAASSRAVTEPTTARPRIRRGLGLPSDVPRPGSLGPSPLVLAAPQVIRRLTADGYVFPVYGPAGFADTFAAPRAGVGWHHGADIFAPLGAPVLAVAEGTLFSVGRNRLGGNRLWLRDRQGNEFYYAHLAAYSPLAANGARVQAGDVIGFVGNTGDAHTTPYHLHFEIHPASLLFMGYDGVVDPTPYLRAWQHAKDVDFPSAAVWVPTLVATGNAPRPGAILLQATDISTENGLAPGSLAQALEDPFERRELSGRAR